MHGYDAGTVEPTTELLLRHKHPEDRERVAAVLDHVIKGTPFSRRHRIIDTSGHTRCVVVAGDRMVDDAGALTRWTGAVTGAQHTKSAITAAGSLPGLLPCSAAQKIADAAPLAASRQGHQVRS